MWQTQRRGTCFFLFMIVSHNEELNDILWYLCSILHCNILCVYLLLVPHPAVFVTHLWIHVIYVLCIYLDLGVTR